MASIRGFKRTYPLYLSLTDTYSIFLRQNPQRQLNVFSFSSSNRLLCYSISFSLLSDQWNSNLGQIQLLKRWFDDIQQFWLYLRENREIGYKLQFKAECNSKILQVRMKARKDSSKSVKIGEILLEQKQIDKSLILEYIAQRCGKKRKISNEELATISIRLLDICNQYFENSKSNLQKDIANKALQSILQDFSALANMIKKQQQDKRIKKQDKRQAQPIV